MEKIAVVILNWNGAAMMRTFLPSVLRHSQGIATVYVADNASTDDSLKLLKDSFNECRVIKFSKNYGFAEGYNKALKQIEAQYYVLLNSDVEVTPCWLDVMAEYMDGHTDVAACQPKLLSANDHQRFEYAGGCGGYIDRYGYPFCRGRLFDTVEKDTGQYDAVTDIFWATGAAMMVRADDYWCAGGLDARFFAHNEEIDLCWRLRLLGKRIVCLPQSKVYHVGGGTLPKGNPMKTYLNFRNNLTMLYKNLPQSELRHVMRLRLLLDYVAALEMLLLKRSAGDFTAVIRARRDFRRWRKDYDSVRKIIQKSACHDIPERRRFSLLWQYYAKGRKLFSDLPAR